MTDWDESLDDTDTAKGAFVQFAACALVWLLQPFSLLTRLCQRSHPEDDAQNMGADWAREGSFHIHNGGCD